MPGVRRALVIAGADKRGAIYAIYDLSEQIGVSPWYCGPMCGAARGCVVTCSRCGLCKRRRQ